MKIFLKSKIDLKFDLPSVSSDEAGIKKKVYETANVLQVPTLHPTELKFAGSTTANQCLVLMTLKVDSEGKKAALTVNCEKIVIGNMLAKEMAKALSEE